jgi:hypothetical protein
MKKKMRKKMKMMKRLGKTFFCTTKIKEIYFLG